jgi:hypothetical protein
MKLTQDDIELISLHKAQNIGDTPSITFKILNMPKVKNFFANNELKKILLGSISDLQTFRMAYQINADKLVLSRNVGPKTEAWSSNKTLVNAVRLLVVELSEVDTLDFIPSLSEELLIPPFAKNYLASLEQNQSNSNESSLRF